MNKATNVKKQILASQIAYKRTQNNEVQLEKALAKFFNKLKKEVLNALDDYWKDYQMLQGHIDLICAPVHEAHKEYYELLTLYIKREYRLGSAEAKRLVRLANSKQRVAGKSMRMPVRAIIKKDNDLFGTLPSAEERLLNRTFTASERTLSRVDSQINQIITDGYRSGKGINDVANSLNQRFDQLTSWESKRIARTEIHNSHNTAVMDTYQELGVEYTMWIAAEDERTRDSHLEINGEIIPMGGEYSNGLKYPGDTSGDIEEWINCRCSNAPFVVPYGFMAPSFSPFREEDLIKIDKGITQNSPVETNPTDTNETITAEEVKQSLNTPLQQITDNPTEHKELLNVMSDFRVKTINAKEEHLIVKTYSGETFTAKGRPHTVTFPKEAVKIGRQEGLYYSGHNHPQSTCLQSVKDVRNSASLMQKYSWTSGDDGFLIIKNSELDLINPKNINHVQQRSMIGDSYRQELKKLEKTFKKDKSEEISALQKQYFDKEITRKEYRAKHQDLFDKYLRSNRDEMIAKVNSEYEKSKVGVTIHYVPF